MEVPIETNAKPRQRKTERQPEPTKMASHAIILLIEDDPGMTGALKMFLTMSGLQLTTAGNGDEALEKLRSKVVDPDLIISDYRLPGGKTGLQIIKHIRERLGRDIPAILLTGDTVSIQPREVEERGCHLMHKPVTGDKLVALINRLIGDTNAKE